MNINTINNVPPSWGHISCFNLSMVMRRLSIMVIPLQTRAAETHHMRNLVPCFLQAAL
jgi:thioesterase domain-containing protein